MSVLIRMPNGGDEMVDEKDVLTIRNALPSEKVNAPEVTTSLWLGKARIYPAEDLASLKQKLSAAKLADLRAPDGSAIVVAMPHVTDCDAPSPTQDQGNTQSVLRFGPGAAAPRLAVANPVEELRLIWAAARVSTAPFQ
jgi:hypothetical protein